MVLLVLCPQASDDLLMPRNDYNLHSSPAHAFHDVRHVPMLLQVFAQSAHMEWHTERSDKVPRNIFELGFKAFATDPGFIAAYVAFLVSQGDVDNARQLFERSLAQPAPPLAIWDGYIAVWLPPVHPSTISEAPWARTWSSGDWLS